MYRCALSKVWARTTTRVLFLLAAVRTELKSEWNPPAMISTAARNLSSAMNICSAVCACATIRISSSTARTLAMPTRQRPELAARISFSIGRSQLAIAHEFVRIDYTSDDPIISGSGAGIGLIGPHHAAAALDENVVLAARHFRRKGNFKLYR